MAAKRQSLLSGSSRSSTASSQGLIQFALFGQLVPGGLQPAAGCHPAPQWSLHRQLRQRARYRSCSIRWKAGAKLTVFLRRAPADEQIGPTSSCSSA